MNQSLPSPIEPAAFHRCHRCGRYEDGARPCPNGDPKCPVSVAPQAEPPAYKGPRKFTPEEVAMGNVGIRWVTDAYVSGRPSAHDVMEYLKALNGAMDCGCDQCKAFYAQAEPKPAQPVTMLTLEEENEVLDGVRHQNLRVAIAAVVRATIKKNGLTIKETS